MENCIFCKIIKGEIPAEKLFENDNFIIIKDVNPMAKVHLLAIPKKHFKYLANLTTETEKTLVEIFSTIPKLTNQLNLDGGYRLIINQGDIAGQTVPHLHIHIVGGEKLGWEPN